jgi:hypothetical protein
MKPTIPEPAVRAFVVLAAMAAAVILLRRAHGAPAETQPGAVPPKNESPGQSPATGCKGLPSADALKKLLKEAAQSGEAGGLAGGHSLFGLAAANPFNPACLDEPKKAGSGPGVCGGTITFGGGVPLYKGRTRVGGLGASGDTACTDHEIAKRAREKAGLDPPGGATTDDIWYTKPDGLSIFAHPLCKNTWRNGKKIGEELPAKGY